MTLSRATLLHYGCLLFLSGLLFYVNFRPQHIFLELIPSLRWATFPSMASFTPSLIVNSLPSFLHITFMCFLSGAAIGINKKSSTLIPIFWLLVDVLLEFLQLGSGSFLQKGVFDWLDIFALITGFVFVLVIFSRHTTKSTTRFKNFKLIPLLTFGLMSSLGSVPNYYDCHNDFNSENCVVPITLTWEELRADIQPEYGDTVSLTRPGKIYSKDYLYIVDQYRGIHIYDQSNPQSPIRVAFIPVIGALEVSIENNILYTNSFIDLVAINLSDIHDGTFSTESYSRIVEKFQLPGNFDFLPDNKSVDSIDYKLFLSAYGYIYPTAQIGYRKKEDQRGFIIGYIDLSGKEVLFGEFN